MRGRGAIRKLLRLGRRFSGTNRPIILMYHRVAKLEQDPWEFSVKPERFARQLEVLRRERDIVPMQWLAKRLREGRLPRNAAAVTFDDGYADVFHNALPILQRLGCPATVFVTTRAISDQSIFWWDILSRIVLETAHLPELLVINEGGRRLEWKLRNDHTQVKNGVTIGRAELHVALHALLKRMDPHQRRTILELVATWAGTVADPRPSDRAMTVEELCLLAKADGISVGAHTCSHPSLPLLDQDSIAGEIEHSRQQCETITGQVITGFAYPYGDLNDTCVQAVSNLGLEYAVTTVRREVGPWTDPLRIPRVLVADWDETEFCRKLLYHG
jgi:peptidoglycan/xylan/chitin deacetylase (PgdA/CDA1 family)